VQWRRRRRRYIRYSSEATMIDLFEHNKTAYEAALALLKEANRACVIHPRHRQVLYCFQMD